MYYVTLRHANAFPGQVRMSNKLTLSDSAGCCVPYKLQQPHSHVLV